MDTRFITHLADAYKCFSGLSEDLLAVLRISWEQAVKNKLIPMDSAEQRFRLRVARSIWRFAYGLPRSNSRTWIELIMKRLKNHPLDQPDSNSLERKVAKIQRYLDAGEIGAAKHELLSLATELTRTMNRD